MHDFVNPLLTQLKKRSLTFVSAIVTLGPFVRATKIQPSIVILKSVFYFIFKVPWTYW